MVRSRPTAWLALPLTCLLLSWGTPTQAANHAALFPPASCALGQASSTIQIHAKQKSWPSPYATLLKISSRRSLRTTSASRTAHRLLLLLRKRLLIVQLPEPSDYQEQGIRIQLGESLQPTPMVLLSHRNREFYQEYFRYASYPRLAPSYSFVPAPLRLAAAAPYAYYPSPSYQLPPSVSSSAWSSRYPIRQWHAPQARLGYENRTSAALSQPSAFYPPGSSFPRSSHGFSSPPPAAPIYPPAAPQVGQFIGNPRNLPTPVTDAQDTSGLVAPAAAGQAAPAPNVAPSSATPSEHAGGALPPYGPPIPTLPSDSLLPFNASRTSPPISGDQIQNPSDISQGAPIAPSETGSALVRAPRSGTSDGNALPGQTQNRDPIPPFPTIPSNVLVPFASSAGTSTNPAPQ